MSTISKRQPGFTLIELLIVMLVSSSLIAATVSTYSLFRKSATNDQSRASIVQNGRVALDRLSREIRQTPTIVTTIPTDPSDTSVAQPGEIEFEDGHAQDLTYRRYYISQNVLKLDINEYYFSYATGTRVRWNAVGTGGVSPLKHVISTQDIADSAQTLTLYGSKPLQVQLVTTDGRQIYTLRTQIYERNI